VNLEGEDGGQAYLVMPASQVQCSEETLRVLLRDLDAICWPGNYEDMARVVYERRPIGSLISGGMGGGQVADGVWIHPSLVDLGLGDEVGDVLFGRLPRLSAEARARRRDCTCRSSTLGDPALLSVRATGPATRTGAMPCAPPACRTLGGWG
jgi:hypothetical protein